VQPPASQSARSYLSNVFGRCISAVGDHHWVVDHAPYQEGPGEQPGPLEYFLSGISSCGVLLVERQAKASGVHLDWLEVGVEGTRKTEAQSSKSSGPSTMQRVDVHFTFRGPRKDEAEVLVEHWKRH